MRKELLLMALILLSITAYANSDTTTMSNNTMVKSLLSKTSDTTKATVAPPDKIPFDGMDQTWLNGNDRRDSSVFHNKYFTPSILIDANITHSFNHPIDHTVVGSTVLAHDDELEVSSVNFGGDFSYDGARGRFMTQFGTRAETVPRNDLSAYHGQYDFANAYRYLSEAYAGYHFNKWYGINVDGGLFLSYIGLNSYYQAENWEYQESYASDNTPWYFTGIRVQIFPTKNLKIEPWIINGWQSYSAYNKYPGVGGNITYCPNENIKLLTNDYWGTDAAELPGRHRFHSDNNVSWRYYNHPKTKGVTKMAFSFAGDIGYEVGDGVDGFHSSTTLGPAQYFESIMFYNRVWFAKNKLAWCIGGGWMNNPGRYLVLPPTGDASPLPNPDNPTQTEGTHPFPMQPGDKFAAWDCSTNISWMPNQSIEFRLEYVHRAANVPYFAGSGGVTSPSGYTTQTLPANWVPDLVKSEDRVILAILFRI